MSTKSVKPDPGKLQVLTERAHEALKTLQTYYYPALFKRICTKLLAEAESKLEDYWITSDEEIRDLVSELGEAIKKTHAIH